MAKILLVEDDKSYSVEIICCLQALKMSADPAYTVTQARELVFFSKYDLIVLDWNLPDGTGPELLKELRNKGVMTPVLMLTARKEVSEIVAGFDAGADDYLCKPFHFDELVARIGSLLRRPPEVPSTELTVGCVSLNTANCSAKIAGKDPDLRRREYQILEMLAKNRGHVISGEQIMQHLWPTNSDVNPEVVKCHVNRLRQKISACSEESKDLIKTVYAKGYRIDA